MTLNEQPIILLWKLIVNRICDTCNNSSNSINSSDFLVTLHFWMYELHSSLLHRHLAQHVQLVTLQNLYRLRIFNKLEVSRLDSRLSSFVIISSYICTLSWCQRVVRIQITFKTIQTPATKEFEQGKLEGKEDHLTAIELHCTTG